MWPEKKKKKTEAGCNSLEHENKKLQRKLLGQCLSLMLNILLTGKREAHRVDMSSNDRRKIPHFLHFDANSQ